MFSGESCFGYLFDGLKREEELVRLCRTSLPADPSLGHELRLKLQERVKLLCMLGKEVMRQTISWQDALNN